MYISLLGAVAYLLTTRLDIAVYVSALQRHAAKPLALHVKRLKALVRWLHRNPQPLVYRRLVGPLRLIGISDSAFKREDESGHAVRGCVVCLASGPQCSTAPQPMHPWPLWLTCR